MKKILYVEINDELVAIWDRIRPLKADEIYLVVPRKALFFQSVINLRILKSKLAELGKILVLITTDPAGCHLARRAGVEVHERVEVKKRAPLEDPSPSFHNQPIQARRNELVKDAPKRFSERKITLKELIHDLRSKVSKREDLEPLFFLRPSRKFLILLLLFSAGLFSLIGYLALSKATIFIQPKSDYLEYTANVILADKHKNQRLLREYNKNVVPSEIVRTVIGQTKVFGTISTNFEGINARGQVTLMNQSREEWILKKGSRLQTEEGLVFRLEELAIIPPATEDPVTHELANGRSTVAVVADEVDIYNNVIGSRGNIGPSRFIFPGLSRADRALVWAVSSAPMKGGVTKYTRIVTQEDIDAAKNQMESNLLAMAREDLKTHLAEINQANHTNLVLLDDPAHLKAELLEMKMSDDLLGSNREKFDVFARVSVEGVAFDFDSLFSILVSEVKNRARPGRRVQVDSLDPASVTYQVADSNAEAGQIKITATLAGIEAFAIDQESQEGSRFAQRVKERVAGLPLKEAESILGNFPEVERVKITPWPFWLDELPPLPENITVEPLEE